MLLKQIFIIQKSGVTLYEKKFEDSLYEFKEMVTAFFSALIVFTEHSLGIGEIKELRCSSVKLLFDSSKDKKFFVVLVVDQFDIADEYEDTLRNIQKSFGKLYNMTDFKGRVGTFDDFEDELDRIITNKIPNMIFGGKIGGTSR
ncbi:MAG: hypothetical protein ACTSP4_12700 [Candidatus Hodarchaeales archaeon]